MFLMRFGYVKCNDASPPMELEDVLEMLTDVDKDNPIAVDGAQHMEGSKVKRQS